MGEQKLKPEQKHILKLIDRDKKQDGWTMVSLTLYKILSKNIPAELATFELVGDVGRAQLTTEGQNIINAMKWL